MKTRPIHVDDDIYAKIKALSVEEKISLGEAARRLILGTSSAAAPGTNPGLSTELNAQIEAYGLSESLNFDAALAKLVQVGLNRVTALSKWIEKKKAHRVAERTP